MKMDTNEALIRVARSSAEMCMPDALQVCLRACFTLIDGGMTPEAIFSTITDPDWQWEEFHVQRPKD